MKPKVIFILGTGHSGGTLLSLLLGTSTSVFAAGECLRVSNLSKLTEQPLKTQAFWKSAVDQLASLGWTIEKLNNKKTPPANLKFWKDWINIVASVSPAPIIVDKTLSIRLIQEICDAGFVDPFFIHLTRSPHGVCYSYYRKYSSNWMQGWEWNRTHRIIERYLKGRSNWVHIGYENLVFDPDSNVRNILVTAGNHFDLNLVFDLPDCLKSMKLDNPIFENYIFSGNRMRNHHRSTTDGAIREDTEYKNMLPRKDWYMVNLFCLFRMKKYGYSLHRKNGLHEANE